MASGTVYTNICGNTTFGTDPVYTIREARWYVSWSTEEVSHGQSRVNYTVWTEKKSESPSEIYTGCTIGIVATTGTIVSGDTSLSFANKGRKVCTTNGTRIKQQTTTGQGEATYSFLINHTTAGAAAFRIDISAVINGNTVGRNGDGVCTLDTNRYDYSVSITNDTGATSSVDGGSTHRGGSSVTVRGGNSTGYTWTGWSGHATTSTNPYTFTMPDSNVAFTSNADPTTYSISFNLGKWALPSGWANPTYYNIESSPITLPSCTKTGYTFSGWSGTGITGVASSVTIPTGSTGNRSYTANGSPNKYYVAYIGNGATSGSMNNSEHTYDTASNLRANTFGRSYTVTYNHNYTGSTNVTRTATYAFAGWNTNTSETGTSYSNQQSVTNLASSGTFNLYAKWTSATVDYTPTRTGYIFGGWFSNSNCSGNAVSHPYTPTNSTTTFYAKWTPITYYVKYESNGGTGTTATSTHNYNAAKNLTANNFKRSGYNFSGWNTVANGSGTAYSNQQSVTNLTSENEKFITLYAQWAPKTFTVTFDSQGGTTPDPANKVVTYDSTYGALPTTIKAGYTFRGWYTSTSFTDQVTASTKVALTSNKTLYAKWTANSDTKYTVYHLLQNVGENTYEVYELDECYGETGKSTEAAERDLKGYELGSPIVQQTISGDGSTVVNIYYNRRYYDLVVLYQNDKITNVVPESGSYQYGAEIVAEATVAQGYTWRDWTCSGISESRANPYEFVMPSNNVTLIANATANTDTRYTVIHSKEALDGTYPDRLKTSETYYGTTAEMTSAKANTYTGFTAQPITQALILANGSTTVTIQYKRNSYTVALDSGVGVKQVTSAKTSYKYEESVTVNCTMDSGYTWNAWIGSGIADSTNQEYTFSMPANNVELQATSTANGYTVTYYARNGKKAPGAPQSGLSDRIVDSVTFDKNYTIRAEVNAFTRTGYKFLGWATTASSNVVSAVWTPGSTLKWNYTASKSLYAVWKSKGVLYVDNGSEFVPYTIWIDSGSTTGGPNNDGWHQYTAWLDTGDESQGTNGWVQLGSIPD